MKEIGIINYEKYKQIYPSNNIYLMQNRVCAVMKQLSAYLNIYIPIQHTWWNLGLNRPCNLTNKLPSKYIR
jgi:hypothetical protein